MTVVRAEGKAKASGVAHTLRRYAYGQGVSDAEYRYVSEMLRLGNYQKCGGGRRIIRKKLGSRD